MISVYDNFLPPMILDAIFKELKTHKFYDDKTHPSMVIDKSKPIKPTHERAKWPGTRTKEILDIAPVIDKLILHLLENLGHPFAEKEFSYCNYAHLRLKKDNAKDFIHQDTGVDFAYLLYLSKSNKNSGTKMYDSCDADKNDEKHFVEFVQNRFVLFSSDIPHMSYGNHGTNIDNGRLTINGFCTYL